MGLTDAGITNGPQLPPTLPPTPKRTACTSCSFHPCQCLHWPNPVKPEGNGALVTQSVDGGVCSRGQVRGDQNRANTVCTSNQVAPLGSYKAENEKRESATEPPVGVLSER